MASSNIDRLAVLINDILDVSKLEAGKIELHKENVNVVDVVKKHVAGWKLKTNAENIILNFVAPDSPILLMLDEPRFLQILSNLMSNAVKFTPEGGVIDVSVKELSTKVEFSIRDTGPGIAEKDMPKLFEKFKQLKRTYKAGIQGTGLGLNIVKSLVELHEGEIKVESELNQGTKFIVSIPC